MYYIPGFVLQLDEFQTSLFYSCQNNIHFEPWLVFVKIYQSFLHVDSELLHIANLDC